MKKIVFVLVACLVTGCTDTPADPEAQAVPIATVVAKTGGGASNKIVKVCDQGRAIYAIRDDNSAALAVVENAAECRGR